MKKLNRLFVLFVCLTVILSVISCRQESQKEKAERIVAEWTGKTVKFPEGIKQFTIEDGLTNSEDSVKYPYTILVYTDSVGCMSCTLKLPAWKQLMAELDSSGNKVKFLFYFHPMYKKELLHVLKRDKFTHPVYIDEENEIGRLNRFPEGLEFHTFLLDENNKIVLIGNPVLNPAIHNLYCNRINGEKGEKYKEGTTTVFTTHPEIEVSGLKVGEETNVSFFLTNTGNAPLVISRVEASCGCTVPLWNRRPVKPGDATEVLVKVKPDKNGYFHKTVQVYCNTENIIPLVVKGTVP